MGINSTIDRILDNRLVPLQAPILHLFLYRPFQLLTSFAPDVTDSDPSDFLDRSSVVHDLCLARRFAAQGVWIDRTAFRGAISSLDRFRSRLSY
jgi:hypothetical protein